MTRAKTASGQKRPPILVSQKIEDASANISMKFYIDERQNVSRETSKGAGGGGTRRTKPGRRAGRFT